MTLQEVKDALEKSSNWLVAERRIQNGVQLQLRCGASVNVYHSGSWTAQGPRWQDVARALRDEEAELVRRAEAGDFRVQSQLKRTDVPSIKEFLRRHGYTILSERRHRHGHATSIVLSGGALVVVHDNGTAIVQGKNTAPLDSLMRAARSRGTSRKRRPIKKT